MIVTVRLFAAYREAAGARQVVLEMADGATLRHVWEALAAQHERLRAFSANVVGAVNAEYSPLDTALHEGDEVALPSPCCGR